MERGEAELLLALALLVLLLAAAVRPPPGSCAAVRGTAVRVAEAAVASCTEALRFFLTSTVASLLGLESDERLELARRGGEPPARAVFAVAAGSLPSSISSSSAA